MSTPFLTWLSDWLGLGTTSTAGDTTWQLDTAWSWSPWATAILLLATITITISLYAREASLVGRWYRAALVALRLLALAIVLIMISQWALVRQITGPPALALVVDRSASMGIADRYTKDELPATIRDRLAASGLGLPTRLNLAKLLMTEANGRFLRELAGRYRLDTYYAAAGIERASNTASIDDRNVALLQLSHEGPDSHATRLGDAVQQVLADFRGAPPAAVVLLTDGVVTEGVPLAGAAEEARNVGVPLFAVGLGSDATPRDIILADVLVDDTVFVNDLVSFQVQIKANGLDGESAKVMLRRESPAGNEPVVEPTIQLPANGQTLNVQFIDRPTAAGEIEYTVEIAPRDDETNDQNNVERRRVTVLDQKIRVLLMYGYPSYEFRFLKTLLERDRTIELATYLQDADADYAEQDKTALRSPPVSRDELFAYDVVLIGDVDPRLMPNSIWQNLRAFVVEKGGGAAFLAGPRYLPSLYVDNADVISLLPIEPVETSAAAHLPAEAMQGFVVRPTPLGLQNSIMQLGNTPADTEQIWRDSAPLYWFYEFAKPKPAAQVLADGAAKPVILFQYVGPGRVLFHAIDATWRWRLGAGDEYFARYWVQTIRFLARGKLTSGQGVRLQADRQEYRRGEPIKLQARFLDMRQAPSGDEVTVLVEAVGEARRRATLRRNPAAAELFEGTIGDLEQGNYEVTLADAPVTGTPPSARFVITAPPGELARTQMDASALAHAAKLTGGKFYRIAEMDQLLADLPVGRRVPVDNLPPVSIWNRWWLLAAFVAAITTEWILRKRKGML